MEGYKTYYVVLITWEGKNRIINRDDPTEVFAHHYEVDGNNNLVFYGTENDPFELLIMYHNYNWFSVAT